MENRNPAPARFLEISRERMGNQQKSPASPASPPTALISTRKWFFGSN